MYVLTLIIFFHFINNFLWLYLDHTYLQYESAEHFLLSFKVFRSLQQHLFPWISDVYNALGNPYRWHGVFVQYLTAPFYFVLGGTQDAGVLVSSGISLAILIVSVYRIGKLLYNKATGCLAAFILSMYPLIFTQSRIYMLDLPLTAMVAFSILLLLRSDGFSSKRYSAIFALAAGVGLLIKFNFVLFVAGPLILLFYKRLRNRGYIQIIRHMATAVVILVLIDGMFYGIKFDEMWSRIFESSWFYWGRSHQEGSFLNIVCQGVPHYLWWILQNCINSGTSFVLFLAVIPGIFLRKTYRMVLWVWFLVPVLVFAFMFPYANMGRYYMPILPALALISSAGLLACGSLAVRWILISILVGLACFQYFAISYRMDFLPEKIQIYYPTGKGWETVRLLFFNRKISFLGYRSDHCRPN